jgi:Flp pilus assembly CpaE family ATPase
VEFVKRHYRYTVLDVPRSEPAALEALEPTAWIVIVANQELATVRSAGRMAASLRLRYGKERVVVAVARHDGSAGIGRADIERAIGVKVKYVLPSDYRRAVEALNSGQPVSLGNHCALAGSFRQIAGDLAALPASDDEPRSSGGFLGLLKGRRN